MTREYNDYKKLNISFSILLNDSYVVVENLRYMLYQYSSSQPIYFGCKFKPYVKQVSFKNYAIRFKFEIHFSSTKGLHERWGGICAE